MEGLEHITYYGIRSTMNTSHVRYSGDWIILAYSQYFCVLHRFGKNAVLGDISTSGL